METGFFAAVLVAAVLVYDRLGGNQEVSRRLFQIGLAVSLVFVVMAGTTAFIRADFSEGGLSVGNNSASAIDQGNRFVTAVAVQYGFGIVFLLAGLVMLRRYHTLPLSFVVSAVFLLLTGADGGIYTLSASLARYSLRSSQKFDAAVFGTAVAGTIALLAYGLQLEREFALDSESEEDEPDAESAGDPA